MQDNPQTPRDSKPQHKKKTIKVELSKEDSYAGEIEEWTFIAFSKSEGYLITKFSHGVKLTTETHTQEFKINESKVFSFKNNLKIL